MKKISFLFTFFLMAQLASAQYDANALEILDAMSAKYKSIPSYEANFSYSLDNQEAGVSEDVTGDIAVKGEKFRLKLGGQEIYNNGTTVWTYLEDANEVNIDNYNPTEGDMTPSKIYSIYKSGYKYVFVEDATEDGQVYHIIDLVPENKNSQFFKVRMKIDKNNKTLKSWEVFDRNGSKNVYEITAFDPTVNLPTSYFEFDPAQHQGVEVIDLR